MDGTHLAEVCYVRYLRCTRTQSRIFRLLTQGEGIEELEDFFQHEKS